MLSKPERGLKMLPFKPKNNPGKGPEAHIKEAICDLLRKEGWFVIVMHCNLYQHGFPDVFATHSDYGPRLIEVKNPKSYSFTKAQLDTFPKLCANGSGVWVLVAATYSEYKKLWCPPNWYQYLQVMK